MILKKLKLENFRGYQNLEIDFDENLNAIVGANDIGKSTILEALDIFFDGNIIKVDSNDLNIKRKKEGINFFKISCQFDIRNKKKILIDSTSYTTFEDEFLLNENKFLEIIHEYDTSKTKLTPKISLNILYPTELKKNLNILKLAELKKLANEMSIENLVENKTKKLCYRKTIYNNLKNKKNLSKSFLSLDKTFPDDYDLWDKIKNELPLYFLFQSDRSNTDKDAEVQNPLKIATKKVVLDLQNQIDDLKNQIKKEVKKVGEQTINELKNFNLDLAENLDVDLNMKNFDTLFSFNIIDEENIPLNKRGSGVRRLMLLSYFMAEAKQNKQNKKIIYAIEEPETAQHPNFQNKILETFKELSNKNCQIMLTTHSPSIVKQLNEDHLVFIKKENKIPIVNQKEQINISEIATTLGITPNILSKVIISVEGDTDINFIKSFNKIKDFNTIVDLDKNNIDFISHKGGNIINWINKDYLKKSDIFEIVICDNDSKSGQDAINKVNLNQNQNRKGILTKMYEIENYIHPSLYNEKYGTNFYFTKDWNSFDIPQYLTTFLKEEPRFKSCYEKDKTRENMIKIEISKELAPKMTKELLINLKCFDEIKNWFEEIKKAL